MTWNQRLRMGALLLAIAGAALMTANVAGLFIPLRSQDIDGYLDFSHSHTIPATEALDRLAALPTDAPRLATAAEATRIVHEGIAHVFPDDVEAFGYDHFRMRVPVTENWILWGLSFIKPDTYRDYEFCSYERAIRRGTGRCGQQALALVAFLEERGFETGFVALGGHAIATVQVEQGWILLDPDYGGVIPFDLTRAEADPGSVLDHYWSPAARQNRLDRLFEATGNDLRYGGAAARYPRACPIETAAYALKWLLPMLLLLVPVPLLLGTRAGGASHS